jgi:hypothetical protein
VVDDGCHRRVDWTTIRKPRNGELGTRKDGMDARTGASQERTNGSAVEAEPWRRETGGDGESIELTRTERNVGTGGWTWKGTSTAT